MGKVILLLTEFLDSSVFLELYSLLTSLFSLLWTLACILMLMFFLSLVLEAYLVVVSSFFFLSLDFDNWLRILSKLLPWFLMGVCYVFMIGDFAISLIFIRYLSKLKFILEVGSAMVFYYSLYYVLRRV